jgi:PAS domain-containing protein
MSVADLVAPDPAWATEEYARFVQDGRWEGEVELGTKDGRLLPAEARAIDAPGSGGPLYVSFLRDLTDRKRREAVNARLATLVQASNEAITGVSLHGIITHWNPAAAPIWARTRV